MNNDRMILEARGVSKTFDGVVRALDDVSIAVNGSEVVGLVGENGAGKSTLAKILVGVYTCDRGKLWYRGQPAPFPRNPAEAARRGITIVYQEKGVIPHLRVFEFMFLTQEKHFRCIFGVRRRRMEKTAKSVLEELHVDCDVRAPMYALPLSTQKMVEIARAIMTIRLATNSAEVTPIIILDEPTAPLTLEERERLFNAILKMKSTASFVLVSHIMPEVMAFADRVYVLRDGRLVAHYNMAEQVVTEADLFRAIVGRDPLEWVVESPDHSGHEVVLAAEGLTRNGSIYDVSFELRQGQCLGFFGPAGSGKSELIRAVAGILSYDKGTLKVNGHIVSPHEPPWLRLRRGIGYFSGETGKELFLSWSICRNVSIANLEKAVYNLPIRVINPSAERAMAQQVVQQLHIRCPSVTTPCYALSGGNKQKTSVGKWFQRAPRILLLEDPTIGIDVGAREDVYRALLDMKRNGMAMILVSDDPKEYATLCDEVITIRSGKLDKTLKPEAFKQEMMGVS